MFTCSVFLGCAVWCKYISKHILQFTQCINIHFLERKVEENVMNINSFQLPWQVVQRIELPPACFHLTSILIICVIYPCFCFRIKAIIQLEAVKIIVKTPVQLYPFSCRPRPSDRPMCPQQQPKEVRKRHCLRNTVMVRMKVGKYIFNR